MKLAFVARILLATLSLCGVTARAAEEKVLNLYIWNDYLAPDTLSTFERETGIKVRVDYYDSNETLQTKLLAGKSGYDVVVPSMDWAARQAQAGVYRTLDRQRLTHYGNLDPQVLSQLHVADPQNSFFVPYMWGTSALAVNVGRVRKALGGRALPDNAWDLVFNPDYTQRLRQCGIAYWELSSDVYASLNLARGKAANDYGETTLADANRVLAKVRRDIRMFNNSPIDPLANGDLCVALMTIGDTLIAQQSARAAGRNEDIRYVIPNTGATVWIDVLGIPRDALHPDNAHRFIDYILRPDVVARISNAVHYANPNLKAGPLLSDALRNNPAVFPSEAVRRTLQPKQPLSQADQRLVARYWQRFKSGH